MPATVDLIHTAGAPRPPPRRTSRGGAVMIRTTSVAFTTELHRLTPAAAAAVFFPVNGEASSISSHPLGSSPAPALLRVSTSASISAS